MEWRLLTDRTSIEHFREVARKLWGVDYPMDYLSRAEMFGYMSETGLMKGGIALVHGTKLRTLSFFSTEARAASPVMRNIPDDAYCEVTGFWFDPEAADRRVSIRAWLQLLRTLRKTGKSQVIWGYNLAHKGLTRLYSELGTNTLFEGEVPAGATPDGNKVARGAILTISLPRFHLFVWKMLVKRTILHWFRNRQMIYGRSNSV